MPQKENKTVLDGATAFRLSDTFGFPRELTAEILEEEGMTMDDKALTRLWKFSAKWHATLATTKPDAR